MNEPLKTTLRLELLGGLRARVNGASPRELSRQQSGPLFAFLALHPNRTHAREQLIDIFWPDDDLEDGRRKLRQSIYTLRRQLASPSLDIDAIFVCDRDTVRLDPDLISTDVADFERAARAAAATEDAAECLRLLRRADELYSGDLLPGFYHEVFEADRRRLQNQHRSLLQSLVRTYESLGDIDRAISAAQRLLALDLLIEEAHADLMRLYSRSGRPSEVIRQFKELEKTLASELGVAPTEATRELAERLRAEAELGPPLKPVNGSNGSHKAVDSTPRPLARRASRRMPVAAVALGVLALPLITWIVLGRPAPPKYRLIDLGTLGGDRGQAVRISNTGVIVGLAADAGNTRQEGCVWIGKAGAVRLPFRGRGVNSAGGVNDSGSVIGIATDNSGSAHPILWDSLGPHQIARGISPEAINARGTVAGNYCTEAGSESKACVWDQNSGMRLLGTLGGQTCAKDISLDGIVVGFSKDARTYNRAFMWSSYGGMHDLGTLGGNNAVANGINQLNQIVGSAQPPGNGPEHAFLWDPDHGMRDIGFAGEVSEAHRINSHGQVVGRFGPGDGRAFIWSDATGPVDLNTLVDGSGAGWLLNSAQDVNESGWIVGSGTIAGNLRPFLLVPIGAKAPAITPDRLVLLPALPQSSSPHSHR